VAVNVQKLLIYKFTSTTLGNVGTSANYKNSISLKESQMN